MIKNSAMYGRGQIDEADRKYFMRNKTIEEDKAEQIEKIQIELHNLEYDHILDIADNIWWGAKKFYDPTKEVVLSATKVQKIMDTHPELLI